VLLGVRGNTFKLYNLSYLPIQIVNILAIDTSPSMVCLGRLQTHYRLHANVTDVSIRVNDFCWSFQKKGKLY